MCIRDRDSDAARSVVLAPPPPITLPPTSVSRALLNELIHELSLLSSVYHKPASSFIGHGRMSAQSLQAALAVNSDEAARTRAIATVAQGEKSENLLDLGDDDAAAATQAHGAAQQLGALGDLLGDDPFAAPAPARAAVDDLGALFGGAPSQPAAAPARNDDLLGLFS